MAAAAVGIYFTTQNNAPKPARRTHLPEDDTNFSPVYLNETTRAQVNQALTMPDGNLTALLRDMHRFASNLVNPGEILFPAQVLGKLSFKSFPFCQMSAGITRSGKDFEQYYNARKWLHQRRDITKMTPKQFVANLKTLNRKITGGDHATHNFREDYLWLKKHFGIGLFNVVDKLDTVLSDDQFILAQSLRQKINYIGDNIIVLGLGGDPMAYRETVLMEHYHGRFEAAVEQDGDPVKIKELQERHLTNKEKKLVRSIYDIKVKLSIAEHAELLEQDFVTWQSSDEDIIARAGKLHFMILKRHSFNDGHGRTARAMTDEFLEQHDLPPVFYSSGDEYRKVATESIAADDPSILIDYFRAHIDARQYLQTMQLADDIQRECIDVKGGSEKCDGVLLGAMKKSGPGFC